jgi:hypothetical protein
MRTYTEIIEECGNEGETWSTFLIDQGNEEFISKLRKTCEKFGEGDDSSLCVKDSGISEAEVDAFVKRRRNGYCWSHNKCDNILNPNIINDEDEEGFLSSYYKRQYF